VTVRTGDEKVSMTFESSILDGGGNIFSITKVGTLMQAKLDGILDLRTNLPPDVSSTADETAAS
jgi:hypothetical protein